MDMMANAGKNAQALTHVAARALRDSVKKGREIVIVMENVWANLSVDPTIVLVLALAALMTVADNLREMRARIAQQIMSAMALLCVVSMIFVEIRVLGHLSAVTYLVIARSMREIVMMTGNVKDPLSVEITIVMGWNSAAVMTVANNQV